MTSLDTIHEAGIDAAGGQALVRWLSERTDLDPRTAEIVPIEGGRSNLTYDVTDGRVSIIVRRPPLGPHAAGAHDMTREHRVLRALAGSAVPVPEIVGLCQDDAVLGAPFLAMHRVAGTVYRRDTDLDGLGPAAGHRIAATLVDTLADLHEVAWQQRGLDAFGRPGGYLARQSARWATLAHRCAPAARPALVALGDALESAVPPEGSLLMPAAGLTHGDYRLDNVLLDTDLRVAAVLDWELSTLGDPLLDLATTCMYWDGFAGLGLQVPPSPGAQPGWPDRHWLIERYARRRGLDVPDLRWRIGLAHLRIAVILDGVLARADRHDPDTAALGAAIGELAHRGTAALEPNEPRTQPER